MKPRLKTIEFDDIAAQLLKRCTLLKCVQIIALDWGIMNMAVCATPIDTDDINLWTAAMYECQGALDAMFATTYNIVLVPIVEGSPQIAFLTFHSRKKYCVCV